jgi:hypothetical protein
MAQGRRAKAPRLPSASRTAKAAQPPSRMGQKPVFCFAHVVKDCDPLWAFNPTGDEAVELLEFLRQMGRSTWRDIEEQRVDGRQKHHFQDAESFDAPARRDFKRSKLGERFGEEMFRFRLGSKKRLWGFRKDPTFHVIWWDPKHKVCPTEMSHT